MSHRTCDIQLQSILLHLHLFTIPFEVRDDTKHWKGQLNTFYMN